MMRCYFRIENKSPKDFAERILPFQKAAQWVFQDKDSRIQIAFSKYVT